MLCVGPGHNKPKMLFVLKFCYLIQNMWWVGNRDIKLLQQHSDCSLLLSSCTESFSEDQRVSFSLPTAWLIRDGLGGDISQYLEIIEKNMPSFDQNRQMWSLKLPLTSFVFWYLGFLWIISGDLTVFFHQHMLVRQQQLELVKIIKQITKLFAPGRVELSLKTENLYC